jgi:hypothetical protein
MKESATAVTKVTDVTHESAAPQDGAGSGKTGRRAIVRAVSVVAAWRRQEIVSWGGL